MIINKSHSEIVSSWLNEQKIYEDLYGNGFFYLGITESGEVTFFPMPPEFTGLFSPIEYDKNFVLRSCFGEIDLDGQLINTETYDCKLYRLNLGYMYPFSRHDESILSAIAFAEFHHKFQKRKRDNSPYIGHLIEVSQLVQKIGNVKDPDIIKAALLHDVLEDTHVYPESIESIFGKKIAFLIDELTYSGKEKKEIKRRLLYEQIAKASDESKIIKLADIISNVFFLPEWSEAAINEYQTWCDSIADLCQDASPDLYQYYQQEKVRQRHLK